MTLKTTLAAPFYHSRVDKLGKGELIYYYAFDRRWMDRETVDLLIRRGLEQNLLGTDGEFFYPLFELGTVEIPIGYKPSSAIFEVDDPVQQLIDRIAGQAGLTQEEVVSEMNAIITGRFDSHIRPEAALVLLAKVHKTGCSDLIGMLESALEKNR